MFQKCLILFLLHVVLQHYTTLLSEFGVCHREVYCAVSLKWCVHGLPYIPFAHRWSDLVVSNLLHLGECPNEVLAHFFCTWVRGQGTNAMPAQFVIYSGRSFRIVPYQAGGSHGYLHIFPLLPDS